eukprot:CAMPEP_0172585696 /NCGR_PEP_ID=MMETSP1068-20121228/5090_1 /TAXON_ID=35684 /ORGANISM="Pseudopedinella elastica, Strain CCMP716" /LENGTH=170 /DNA_ID=CAMNT_0013380245 /DNA_START=64 /DNA_END=576 /DNA_ORIENTATION=+
MLKVIYFILISPVCGFVLQPIRISNNRVFTPRAGAADDAEAVSRKKRKEEWTAEWKGFRSKMVAGKFGLGPDLAETAKTPSFDAPTQVLGQDSPGGLEVLRKLSGQTTAASLQAESRVLEESPKVALTPIGGGDLSRKLLELQEAYQLGLIDGNEYEITRKGILDYFVRR